MREILFRGKRQDNNTWTYGSLIQCGITGKTYIFPTGDDANESSKINEEGCLRLFTFEVDAETVGQYVAGMDFYEGDKLYGSESGEYGVTLSTWTGVVKYNADKSRLMVFDDLEDWYEVDDFDFYKVTGTIHD